MASFTKWLGAGLGFVTGGPIGAAIGFAVGSFIDGFTEEDIVFEQQEYQQRRGQQRVNTQSGDFEISLTKDKYKDYSYMLTVQRYS